MDIQRPYVAFYKGRNIELYASSSFEAQRLGAKQLGVKDGKSHEVTVYLADVKHDPSIL